MARRSRRPQSYFAFWGEKKLKGMCLKKVQLRKNVEQYLLELFEVLWRKILKNS